MDKQRTIDQLFELAKQDQTVQSFEQTQERFILSLEPLPVKKTSKHQVFTKKWIIMLATVSTITLSAVLLWNQPEKNIPTKISKTQAEEIISPAIQDPKSGADKTKAPLNHGMGSPNTSITSFQEPEVKNPENETEKGEFFPTPESHKKTPRAMLPEEDPYQFPKLTEEEIAATRKKKKSMLKTLVKHDKNAYSYIPSGSFNYNGDTVSVQAYYIGTTEVTNLEYRTFLFDLLIQNRKEEFLKAKPDQSMWLKEFGNLKNSSEGAGKRMQEYYFSHPAYNEYPVVNISREGAELYCKWLSEEVRKYVGDEKGSKFNDIRLPLRVEWTKAASDEGKQLPYPWGGPFTRNSKGLILANYTRTKEEITEEVVNKTVNNDITAPSRSYWPNELGIYNLSGNVAEMVYEGIDKTGAGTAGGSWRSDQEEIKIYAPDPYSGVLAPKPTIGFRVVSTYLILYK